MERAEAGSGAGVGPGASSARGSQPAGPSRPGRRLQPTRPVAVDTSRIILAGQVCWAIALVVVLAVPDLHTGPRDWWPWACVSGLILGVLGLLYVRRGRGNAAGARRS